MSGTTTSFSGATNQAFFAALLPNVESQIVNEFQFTGLTTLQSFESQFSSSTKYLQLSTSQVALSTAGSAYTLLIQGTGLSIPGASVAGILNTGSLSLASVTGSVTAAQLYAGGTFHNGTVTGGTVVASGVFSATKLTLTAGSLGVVINGANMPTTPAAVAAIAAGTYAGPAISVSSVQLLNNGTQVGSITLGATSITFISDDYKLVLNGTFPTSLSSSVIDSLIGTSSSNPLGISLTSAQLSRVSTGQVLLTVPSLSYQDFTGTDVTNLPGAIASIAAAAAAGDSASINTGTLQTAVDATLNGSTMQVAGIGTAAVLGFTGDSAITASNPSIDGTAVITNLVSGQTAAGEGVLNAAGIFVNGGTILAGGPAGSTMTIDVTAAVTNGLTTQGLFTNDAKITANAGNQLIIAVSAAATLVNNGTISANGGSIFVDLLPGGTLTSSGVDTIGDGGTIETNAGGAGSRYVFVDGAAGDRLKIDAPGTFSGAVQGFRAGDTIGLGGSLAAGSLTYTASTGTLLLDNSGGTVLADLTVSGLGLNSASGTFTATGSVGQFIISRGANGDTLLTTTAAATTIVSSGTLSTPSDQTLIGNTIEAAGLSGPAVLNFHGDSGISDAAPTVDSSSVIVNAVPGQSGTGQTALNANGDFVNDGTILADGPAGSTFTVNIATNGTTPGYFINYGSIIADAGNTVVINVANNTALLNPGTIIANGGSVLINAAGGLDGGYVPVLGVAAIENGGTLETNASYLSGLSGTTPTYLFLDGVAGDTLKLDHASQIGARISDFQAGDTIDLGGSLAVGTIVYNLASSVLALENSAGSILASFVMGGSGSGTYAVNGVLGIAGPYVVSQGADGDTLLTTTTTNPAWNNTAGTWQTASGWTGQIVPTASLAANIGLGSTAAFTLTTGSAPAAADALNEYDPNALIRITSNTTIAGNSINLYNGSLEVTAGNTLTGDNVRLYAPSDLLTIDQGALLDLYGRLNSNFENGGTIAITNGNSSAVAVNGSILVNAGTLNAGPGNGQDGGSFAIGYDGDGTSANVTVENGGSVSDTYTLLGSGPTSSGTLVLTGVGTTWTDEIDPGDTLNSRGYMIVGFNNLAADAPWAGQPPLAGTAQLTVENGATLTDTRAWIGDTGDSAGAVTVSNGGVWNVGVASGGYLDLSTGGAASLSILNAGTVNVGNPAVYPVQTGTFVNNGATVTASGIGVGFTAGASGTITVSGTGSALNDAYGLALGVASQGVLDVVNAGTAYLYGGINAGITAGASGTILVSGADSSLTADQINVGNAGTGMLTVANGGSVDVWGTVAVGGGTTGRNGSSTGNVNVDTGGSLQAAYGLAIWAGSTVSVDTASAIDVGYYGDYVPGAVQIDYYFALLGDGVVAANVNNTGTLEATNNATLSSSTGGKLEITGAVTGTGSIAIASGATLQLDGAVSSGQRIAFLSGGAPETLILAAPAATMANAITGFAAGDKIEFANGVTITAVSMVHGNTLAAVYHTALNVTGTYDLTNVSLGSNPSGVFSVGTDPATNDAYITAGGVPVSAASPAVITGTQPGITTTGTAAATPFAHVKITDPNVNQTETVTVTLSSAANGALSNLGAGSYNAATGVYTVTGSAAAVTAALDALAFTPAAYEALPGQTITTGFTISDTDTAAATASDAITTVVTTATGTLATIASGGTLTFAGGLPTGEAIAFSAGTPETLILGAPTATIPNLITGWTLGDRIEFTNGITITGEQILNSGLAISYSVASGVTGTYDLTGLTGLPATGFNIGNDPVTNDTYIMPTQYYAWSGTGSTNFAAGGSWLNAVAPNSTGIAQFYNGTGSTISGSGSVEGMNFSNTDTWALAAGTYLAASLYVSVGGNSGTTKLAIGSGGTIASAGYIDVGNAAGGAGILTISGGGLLTQSAPINLSSYAMSIGSSPASGTLAAASGSVTVTGAGSMIDLGYNGLVLANNGGNASLTVSQGGSLLATTTNSNSGNSLSIGRLGNGTLTVIDAGSQVTAVGEAYVSHSGTGTLTVQNYGTFIAAADLTGLAGLTIGSGNTVGVGGAGYATVMTGGDLISQGFVDVGARGTSGDLSVLNGGTVQVGSTLTVGSGGTIQNGATYGGNGTVTIGAGGTIDLTGGPQTAAYGVYLTGSNIGAVTASSAVMSVSGAGALLNTDGNGIAVGHYGAGTLTVSQGGSVVSGTANSTLISALAIGRQGSGTVTVTGAGSQLTANGVIYVGRAGTGSLNILNQGTVVAGVDGTGSGGVDIGGAGITNGSIVYSGGSGAALVSGGGILTSRQDIVVGTGGTSGILSVAGGTVQAGTDVLIGASITLAAGDTDITPAGTTVTTAASVLNGAGLVTVGTGGVIQVAATGLAGAPALIIGTAAGATGTLSVAGGTVTAFGGLSIAQGSTVSVTTGAVDIGGTGAISSGTIDVDAGFAAAGSGLIQAAGIINNGTIDALGGGTLTLAGGITGTGTLALAGGATLHLAGAIGAGQTIAFGAGSAETLILDKPGSGLSNAVTGFANGDRIEFAGGMTITSAAMVNVSTIAIGFTNAGGTAGVYDITDAGSHRLGTGTDAATGDRYIEALPAIGSDLNGDGTGDIVWRNAGTGQTLGFLMNNGTLATAIGLLYNTAWTAAGTGDFNGDGTGDILWRNAGTGQVIEYLLNNGTVSSAVNLLYSPVWTVAGIGDFNGDGTSDILWRNAGTGQVVEYLMNNGTEASAVNLLYSTAWTVAGTGDFNGDGTSDILWRNTVTGQLEEYLMSNGTLASAINLLTDIDSTVVGTGDFTGDGIDDILLRNRLTGTVTEEVMNAGGQIAESIVLLTSQSWTVGGTGDYTGNGTDDILWRNAGTGQVLEGLMSGGVQTSFINLIYNTAWQVSGSPVSESGMIPPVDDLNGAGQSDILWVNTVTGEVNEWLNNGAVTGDVLTSTVWSVAGAGDFTGDGVSDILWRNAATGQVLDWQMNGTTDVSSTSILTDPNATVAGTGDFYGNGDSDILMHNATTGATVDYEMAGSTVINETTLLTNVNWAPVGVGDFNGDGTADILWRNPTTGAVVMWEMAGGAPSATMTLLTDPNWTVAGVGDFNGNGMSDIVWRNAGSGQVLVWMMNGSNVLSSTTLLTDPNATVTGVGDYTGNGNSDILMTNSTTGRTVEYLMNGSSVTGTQTLLTDTAWHPVTSLLAGG